MYLLQASGIQQTISEYLLAISLFICTLFVWYFLNLGGSMYSPKMFPWPYTNGAGSISSNASNTNTSVNGHLIKLGLTFFNITIVLLYGWWFWKAVPRNFVSHSLFF